MIRDDRRKIDTTFAKVTLWYDHSCDEVYGQMENTRFMSYKDINGEIYYPRLILTLVQDIGKNVRTLAG